VTTPGDADRVPDRPDQDTPAEPDLGRAPGKAADRPLDPEDWASSPDSDDERYARERPPHWE
jgi:hypothetical protein